MRSHECIKIREDVNTFWLGDIVLCLSYFCLGDSCDMLG